MDDIVGKEKDDDGMKKREVKEEKRKYEQTG